MASDLDEINVELEGERWYDIFLARDSDGEGSDHEDESDLDYTEPKSTSKIIESDSENEEGAGPSIGLQHTQNLLLTSNAHLEVQGEGGWLRWPEMEQTSSCHSNGSRPNRSRKICWRSEQVFRES